jgi:hypothetical protein
VHGGCPGHYIGKAEEHGGNQGHAGDREEQDPEAVANGSSDPELRIADISLDCADPVTLADFYLALFDGVELWRSERSIGLRVRGIVLAMQRVDGYVPPTWPGSAVMHLDLTSDGDLGRHEARAIGLGARRSQFQPDHRWSVLIDPAGPPFCLTTVAPPG